MSGFVLWFTGLSGSGKSTLATRVAAELEGRGRIVQIVDGDEFRKALSKGLTFSREDRDENVRRIGFVARLLAKTGACAITSTISPFREIRDEQRAKSDRFVEVYCRAALDALVLRDPKGLYAKALAGEIPRFTGVSDPYEEPLAPEVIVDTDRETVDASVARILRVLEERGLLGPAEDRDVLAAPWGIAAEEIGPDDAGAEQLVSPSDVEVEPMPGDPLAPNEADTRFEALLASGLLAPVTCAMNERDALKVERTGRLESGLAFPFVVRGPRATTTTGLAGELRATLRRDVTEAGPVAGLILLRGWERAHRHLASIALEVCGRLWLVAAGGVSRSIPDASRAHPNMRIVNIPGLHARMLSTTRAFALTQVVIARNLGFREIVLDVPEHVDVERAVVRQGRDVLSDLTQAELGLRVLAAGPVYEGEAGLATARTVGA